MPWSKIDEKKVSEKKSPIPAENLYSILEVESGVEEDDIEAQWWIHKTSKDKVKDKSFHYQTIFLGSGMIIGGIKIFFESKKNEKWLAMFKYMFTSLNKGSEVLL